VLDITDTLRCLRAADALRQRGTTLKTSGGYEIFVDQRSANAIYALRTADNSKLMLIESDDIISAGEANLASSDLSPQGDLRITFNRGSFSGNGSIDRAVESAVFVINDIQADVIASFDRRGPVTRGMPAPGKAADDIRIQVEGVPDNMNFASRVCAALAESHPELGDRATAVPSLQYIEAGERELYLNGRPVDWKVDERRQLLGDLEQFGHRSQKIDIDRAFDHTRLVKVHKGSVVIEAGTPAGFVFIPLGEGLRIAPLGGYHDVPAPIRVPLGNTGVIRGSVRNARIFAEADVELLMIPQDVYLERWHATYGVEEVEDLFRVHGFT